MISAKAIGDFNNTVNFLKTMLRGDVFSILDYYGRVGVDLLSSATPVDTGRAASSWGYQTTHSKDKHSVSWFNTDDEGGINVAVILQYGHGTGTGGWVEGRDYINPVMQPLFDKMADDIWKQVRNA